MATRRIIIDPTYAAAMTPRATPRAQGWSQAADRAGIGPHVDRYVPPLEPVDSTDARSTAGNHRE